MAKQYITLVAPEEVIGQLQSATTPEGVELGNSRPADALSDAADSPLGPEEIKQLLQVLTVAFTTGSAAIAFFKQLKGLLGKTETAPASVELKDGRTGRHIATVDRNSDPEELARSLGK